MAPAIAAASAPRAFLPVPIAQTGSYAMTRPGGHERSRVVRHRRRPTSWSTTTAAAASPPASRTASCSPMQRIGRSPASTARAKLPGDPLVGLGVVAAPLAVADDDPAREPVEHRRADVAGERAGDLVVDVLGADGDVLARVRERVADGGEADERRADDPLDARRRASATAIVRASSPASAGRRVHLPVGGDDHGTHRSDHARARCGRARRPPPSRASVGAVRRPRRDGEPGARPVRAPAGQPSGGGPAARPARRAWLPGVSRRASATSRTTYGCSASRPSASSSPIAAICRPAAPTARWRFADSAFRTRFRSPRSARDTWRASSSRSAPPAPIRRRNRPTVSPLFHVTTPRPRRIRHDAGSPTSPSRSASDRRLVRVDDELEVRPAAREAERAAGEEQAAQVGHPAVLGGRRPIERGRPAVGSRSAAVPRRGPAAARPRPSRIASRATGPSRAGVADGEAGRLGAAIARPRRDRSPRAPPGGR